MWTLSPGVPIGCRSPRKRGPYSMPIHKLRDAAIGFKQECEIYDVERIRGALDSPEGYGLRVGYLYIAMNADEQVAFFATR